LSVSFQVQIRIVSYRIKPGEQSHGCGLIDGTAQSEIAGMANTSPVLRSWSRLGRRSIPSPEPPVGLPCSRCQPRDWSADWRRWKFLLLLAVWYCWPWFRPRPGTPVDCLIWFGGNSTSLSEWLAS